MVRRPLWPRVRAQRLVKGTNNIPLRPDRPSFSSQISIMNAREIIYTRWLSVAIPLLCFLLWTTTSSPAYPCLSRRNYLHLIEPNPILGPKDSAALHRPHRLKGPLWCNGTITADPSAGEKTYVCDDQTLCKGATNCNGALVCTGPWFDDGGMLACRGDLLCDGRLVCNEMLPGTCLPGLQSMPNWALGLLLGFLISISGMVTGCIAAFTCLFSPPDPFFLPVELTD